MCRDSRVFFRVAPVAARCPQNDAVAFAPPPPAAKPLAPTPAGHTAWEARLLRLRALSCLALRELPRARRAVEQLEGLPQDSGAPDSLADGFHTAEIMVINDIIVILIKITMINFA